MKISIKQKAYDKIIHWVKGTDIEVSGFGLVEQTEEGELIVTDAFLVEQEGGSAHTDIDGNALAKLMHDTRGKGGKLRYWWHSHVNMATFWSGQDKDTIHELGEHGWILATVFNKKEESRTALCYTANNPFGSSTLVLEDELTLSIDKGYTAEEIASWDAELKEKVKTKKYIPPATKESYTYTPPSTQQLLGSVPVAYDNGTLGYDNGMLGYGTELEAKYLGMAPYKYEEILDLNINHPKYKKAEEDLMVGWTNGSLDELSAKDIYSYDYDDDDDDDYFSYEGHLKVHEGRR